MAVGEPMVLACVDETRAGMRTRLSALRASLAARAPAAGLADVARRLADELVDGAPIRAALVAANARQARSALDELERWLADGEQPQLRVRRGAMLAIGDARPRVGLLLPGQGASAPAQLGALGACFPDAAAAHARARVPSHGGTVPEPAVQLAIVAASLAALEALRGLGVDPAFALGHSLGELTALSWAGAFDAGVALRLAGARGAAMVRHAQAPGGMATVDAEPAALAELLERSQLSVACFNAPARHVVSGPAEAIDAFVERAHARDDVRALRLDVTGAFHSPLMREAATAFGDSLETLDSPPLTRDVVSTVTGTWLAPDVDVRAHLRRQMLAPVRFLDAARVAARHADLLVEAGPGAALAASMTEIADVPVVSLRAGDRSPRGPLELLAVAWVAGLAPAPALTARLPRAAGDQPNVARSRLRSAPTTSS